MIKEFRWSPIFQGIIKKTGIARIKKEFHLSRIASEILLRRGVDTSEKIRKYLYGSYEDLYSPFLFKDMLRAVSRILEAVAHKEKVLIHGDYDVDGITATAMVKYMFENLDYHNVKTLCPSRSLGYGLSKNAVKMAIRNGYTLIITVDCGSNEKTAHQLAKRNGIDIIVLDHHSFQKRPDVYCFINPEAGDYPFPDLCGCGVAFKLVQAMNTQQRTYPEQYLDMVALATIADSVPLVDENRILTKLGLKQLRNTDNVGLRALLKACGFLYKKLSTEIVGFVIAPRINAPGRLSSPRPSIDLMLTIDADKAERLALKLSAINKKRIEINHQIRDEAIKMVEDNYMDDPFLVLSNDSWKKGIIGIVASTMVEIFHKPTVIISGGYGSVRTVPEYTLLDPLSKCSDLFVKWGGHPMAAGLSIKKRDIPAFRKRINSIAGKVLPPNPTPNMAFDRRIPLKHATFELVKELEKLEPFGNGNPLPYFVTENVTLARDRITKDGQHIQLSLSQDKALLSSIGFWMAHYKDIIKNPVQKFDVLYMLGRSKMDTEQIVLRDLKEVQLNW